MLRGLPFRKEVGGDQGTPKALLGSAPHLRELRLEDSLAGPLPLLHQIPTTVQSLIGIDGIS